ncbi:hypothetical protein AB0B83_21785 [Micromonospora sp. NPDC049060]|uniref:hypothetical protein n=1 Tax=Micromonospora sp. NPDC049060 TaxID=3154828 RepID=UPI0033DE2A54
MTEERDASAGTPGPPEASTEPAQEPRARRSDRVRAMVRRLSPAGPPAGRWFAGVLAAVVTAMLTAWLLAWGLLPGTPPPPPPDPDALPFTVAVRVGHEASDGWVVAPPLAEVPARPAWAGDWSRWAREAAGTPASRQYVYFTVQGVDEAQVTLTDLRVRVMTRRPALRGVFTAPGGGGPTAYRWVEANLDEDPPVLTAGLFDEGGASLPEHERKEIRFPYRVSLTDAETFLVIGHTVDCDCDWTVEVDWASRGRTGTVTVDDAGRPFRVTGTAGVQTECWTYPDGMEECRRR